METNLILLIGFFALLYSFSDAWHDENVIRGQKKWHKVDAFIKGVVAVTFGAVVFIFTQNYYLSIGIPLIIILMRASTFNFFINRLMDYPKGHRSDKSFWDKVPTWIWWILLVGLFVFLFVSCENPQMK